MRLLLDTNIVLDVLLAREPWVEQAKALWAAVDDGRLEAFVTTSTLTDIFYVARRLRDAASAWDAIRLCLDAFEICAIDRITLEVAVTMPGRDFEDNLQVAAALHSNLDAIVTRNLGDFAFSSVPILSPEIVLSRLG